MAPGDGGGHVAGQRCSDVPRRMEERREIVADLGTLDRYEAVEVPVEIVADPSSAHRCLKRRWSLIGCVSQVFQ
jgi:hypothetical protein